MKELVIRNLTYAYPQDRTEMLMRKTATTGLTTGVMSENVLSGLSMSLEYGELVSILGKNGAGKSTMFKCILGIFKNYQGEILIENEEVRQLTARELSQKVAYIPQNRPQGFSYSALEMVLMGAANRLPVWNCPKENQKKEAMESLRKVGAHALWNRSFSQLSGGEQQLVMMARALMQKAHILVMDEPLANMDYGNQIRMLQEMRELTENGYLILQTIHNPDQAYAYSDRILAMKDGRILRNGRPDEVLDGKLIRELYGEDIIWRRAI